MTALRDIDIAELWTVFLVDDSDEHNFELLIAFISLRSDIAVVTSLFNENIAPHSQAAHPGIRILNPARIAAPSFIAALDTPLSHSLSYAPVRVALTTQACAQVYSRTPAFLLRRNASPLS